MAENQGVVEKNVYYGHGQCGVGDDLGVGKPDVEAAEQIIHTDKDDAPLAEVHEFDGGSVDAVGVYDAPKMEAVQK